MKELISVLLLLGFAGAAMACPDLTGEYSCTFSEAPDENIESMSIQQSATDIHLKLGDSPVQTYTFNEPTIVKDDNGTTALKAACYFDRAVYVELTNPLNGNQLVGKVSLIKNSEGLDLKVTALEGSIGAVCKFQN